MPIDVVMEAKKEGVKDLQSAGSMYTRMYGASPIGGNSCRSSKFSVSKEEDDDLSPLDFQIQIQAFRPALRISVTALWTRISAVWAMSL